MFNIMKNNFLPSVMVLAYNPALEKMRQEDHQFKASLGYTEKGQPQLYSETLSQQQQQQQFSLEQVSNLFP
jgi:hypothetical protein